MSDDGLPFVVDQIVRLNEENRRLWTKLESTQNLLDGALQLLSEAGKMPSSTELIAAAERAEKKAKARLNNFEDNLAMEGF